MLKYYDMSMIGSWHEFSLARTLVVLAVLCAAALVDMRQARHGKPRRILFGCAAGTILSFVLIRVGASFTGSESLSSYEMAFALLAMILGWKLLFGAWQPSTKAALLGTFVFWITFHLLAKQDPTTRMVHLFSMGFALVPAAVWCALFLKYHAERFSVVLLSFFAGMLSTAPILFYDTLVRSGAEFQFFLFRVTPESFSRTTHGFVSGQLAFQNGTQMVLMSGFVSFLIVAIIEEVSKFWALSHSGQSLFRSIDDALELAIIVAVGFAFAENVVNPVYFGGFVREYLLGSGGVDVVGFLSNILGRSVLTSMVHILSTGVFGYCLGRAVFAGSYLAEEQAAGKTFPVLTRLHHLLQVREVTLYRFRMMTIGLIASVGLHGLFNFMVTLPDMLPSNPQTIAALIGKGEGTLLDQIPLLLFPSMLYVVGGFWLLTSLFLRRENMEERGRLVTQEVYVKD